MAKKETVKMQFRVGDVFDEAFNSLSERERRDTLESVAYLVKDESYTRKLTQEELADRKSSLAEVSIKIAEIEDAKKNAMAGFKQELEGPNVEKKELLVSIKHKTEYREGTLFYMDDQDAGVMNIFDAEGVCVESRILRQDERQTKMRTLNSGTNG